MSVILVITYCIARRYDPDCSKRCGQGDRAEARRSRGPVRIEQGRRRQETPGPCYPCQPRTPPQPEEAGCRQIRAVIYVPYRPGALSLGLQPLSHPFFGRTTHSEASERNTRMIYLIRLHRAHFNASELLLDACHMSIRISDGSLLLDPASTRSSKYHCAITLETFSCSIPYPCIFFPGPLHCA